MPLTPRHVKKGSSCPPRQGRGREAKVEGKVETVVIKARSGGPRRSCNRCSIKKEKCTGEVPCGRCTIAGTECIYSYCRTLGRPRASRVSKKRPPPNQHSQAGPSISLKRATLSPSSATGLPGLIEDKFLNCFLEDFVPFYPVMDGRMVRFALISIMKGKVGQEILGLGEPAYTAEDGRGRILPMHNEPCPDEPPTLDGYATTSALFSGMVLGGLLMGVPTWKVQNHLDVAVTSMQFCGGQISEQVVTSHFLLAICFKLCDSTGDVEGYAKHVFLAKKSLEELTRREGKQPRLTHRRQSLHDALDHRTMIDRIHKKASTTDDSVTPILPQSSSSMHPAHSVEYSGKVGMDAHTTRRKRAVPVEMTIDMITHLGLSSWSPDKRSVPVLGGGLREVRRLIDSEMKQFSCQNPLGNEGQRGCVPGYFLGGTFLGVLASLEDLDAMQAVAEDMVNAVYKCPGVILFQPHTLHILLATLKAHGQRRQYEAICIAKRHQELPTFDDFDQNFVLCESSLCHGYTNWILKMGIDRTRQESIGDSKVMVLHPSPFAACDDVKTDISECSDGLMDRGVNISLRRAKIERSDKLGRHNSFGKLGVVESDMSTYSELKGTPTSLNVTERSWGYEDAGFGTRGMLEGRRLEGYQQEEQMKVVFAQGRQDDEQEIRRTLGGKVLGGVATEGIGCVRLQSGQEQSQQPALNQAIASSIPEASLTPQKHDGTSLEEDAAQDQLGLEWKDLSVPDLVDELPDTMPEFDLASFEGLQQLCQLGGGNQEAAHEQVPLQQLWVTPNTLMTDLQKNMIQHPLTASLSPLSQHQRQQQYEQHHRQGQEDEPAFMSLALSMPFHTAVAAPLALGISMSQPLLFPANGASSGQPRNEGRGGTWEASSFEQARSSPMLWMDMGKHCWE